MINYKSLVKEYPGLKTMKTARGVVYNLYIFSYIFIDYFSEDVSLNSSSVAYEYVNMVRAVYETEAEKVWDGYVVFLSLKF